MKMSLPASFFSCRFTKISKQADVSGRWGIVLVPLPGPTRTIGALIELDRSGRFLLASDALSIRENLDREIIPRNTWNTELCARSFNAIKTLEAVNQDHMHLLRRPMGATTCAEGPHGFRNETSTAALIRDSCRWHRTLHRFRFAERPAISAARTACASAIGLLIATMVTVTDRGPWSIGRSAPFSPSTGLSPNRRLRARSAASVASPRRRGSIATITATIRGTKSRQPFG